MTNHIMFIGPSTSKFDYLALAYFAEYGVWPMHDQVSLGPGQSGPNPLYEWNVRNVLCFFIGALTVGPSSFKVQHGYRTSLTMY